MNTCQSDKETVSASSDAADFIAPLSNDPGACRYRCAHVAWLDVERVTQTSSQTAVSAMAWQVERVSAQLHQLDLIYQLMAFFRPPETVSGAQATTGLSCCGCVWVPQAHLAMPIAMYAMQSLWLHSAWQLLAHPRNHVARFCLNASCALLNAFKSSLFHFTSLSRECRNIHQKASEVIGEGANWAGHQLATSDLTPTETSNSIRQQMQAKGWELLSSIHADKSKYFFTNQHKLMMVEIASMGVFSSSSALTYVSSFIEQGGAKPSGSSSLCYPSRKAAETVSTTSAS